MVKYSFSNSKLKELARWLELSLSQVISFDLPAGWTCSKAGICKTLVSRDTGKELRAGRIKCYAAKAECYAPNTRRMRWYNFNELVSCEGSILKMAALLESSLPNKVKVVRIHSSGDFFSKNYFRAWVKVATNNPNVIFFGYTKHLDYAICGLPNNMFLEYSYGSTDDNRMKKLDFPVPTCFIGEYDNQYPNLRVVCSDKNFSHEDYFAILNHESFVISMH